MINGYYIKINFDQNLLKQFLSYIDENTSIKWAGGEPTMQFLHSEIDGIFINDNKMKFTDNLNYIFENLSFYNNFEEITINDLNMLNSKILFYD